jgi:hypothetical protein
MLNNDISNEIAPKIVVVIDGLVARVPEDKERLAQKFRRRSRWEKLAGVYDFDTLMVAHLWDIVQRSPWSHDLVSFESSSDGWYEALERRLDRFNVPFSRLECMDSADEYGRILAFRPEVKRVFFSNPDWVFHFGGRGSHVGDVNVFSVMH